MMFITPEGKSDVAITSANEIAEGAKLVSKTTTVVLPPIIIGIIIFSNSKKNFFKFLKSTQKLIVETKVNEEEKYSLHGISAGIGLYIPGKTNVLLQAKVFDPLYREVTLYGRYIGVPFQSLITENDLSYKAKIDITRGKFGFGINLEILNLGAVENPKS